VLDQVTVDIASGDKTVQLRATGSVVKFNGFLTLYDEGQDDKTDDEETGARSCRSSISPSRRRAIRKPAW